MNTSTQRTGTVLTAGSLVFGASALLLVISPGLFNELLGLTPTPDLDWAMRMIGITLVALAGNMFSVARRGGEASVRLSGRIMQSSAFALGVLTLLIPVPVTWFTACYAAVGFGFSLAYTFTLDLSGKRR